MYLVAGLISINMARLMHICKLYVTKWQLTDMDIQAIILLLFQRKQEGGYDLMAESFPDGKYADISGLCKVSTLAEIEAQGWSLNPGRYVGVATREEDDFDFKVRLEEQNEELEVLNAEARELETRIAENVANLLEAE